MLFPGNKKVRGIFKSRVMDTLQQSYVTKSSRIFIWPCMTWFSKSEYEKVKNTP